MDLRENRHDILEVLARLVSTDSSKIQFYCGEHASNKQSVLRCLDLFLSSLIDICRTSVPNFSQDVSVSVCIDAIAVSQQSNMILLLLFMTNLLSPTF